MSAETFSMWWVVIPLAKPDAHTATPQILPLHATTLTIRLPPASTLLLPIALPLIHSEIMTKSITSMVIVLKCAEVAFMLSKVR